MCQERAGRDFFPRAVVCQRRAVKPYICYAEAHGQGPPMRPHSPLASLAASPHHIARLMNPFLRFTACLLVILVVSAAAALAWDQGDRVASQQAEPQATGAAQTGR